MANSRNTAKNSNWMAGALTLTAQTTCPIASGQVGVWVNASNSLLRRSADGTDKVIAAGGGGQLFQAVTKTSGALAGSPDYANGTAGVGATLTKHTAGALPAQGGVTLTAGQVLLVDSQVAPAQNGLYVVTDAGGATAWVLTRLVGFDTASTITDGALVAIQQGTFAGEIWEQTASVTTVGTDAITFSQPIDLMTLDGAQSVSGAKTYADGTLKQSNAGGTFATTFASGATAARIATFPDASFTVPQDSLVAHLAGAEAFTGAKTFTNAGPAKVNNAADTFATTLASAATANRTLTLPDATDTVVALAATQTLTNKTLTSPTVTTPTLSGTATLTDTSASIGDSTHRLAQLWAMAVGTAVVTDAYNATMAFDASAGSHHKVTLTGNITSWNITNGVAGQFVTIQFTQDGTGNRTLAGANAGIKTSGGTLTLTATASKTDTINFRFDGSTWWESGRAQSQ